MLADELHLLLEGARVTAQSVGADGLGARLMRMGEAMIARIDAQALEAGYAAAALALGLHLGGVVVHQLLGDGAGREAPVGDLRDRRHLGGACR